MCRKRWVVISVISFSIVSASRQLTTFLVMLSRTGSTSAGAPLCPMARTISRSDRMPTTLPDSSATTTQPTR
jgi:hypothetical protein